MFTDSCSPHHPPFFSLQWTIVDASVWRYVPTSELFQWTIVDASVWRNVPTSELLLMYRLTGRHVPLHGYINKSSLVKHVPPHGYINNSSLVDTFLHTKRFYQWTIFDVSVWRNVSTSELLLMYPCGGTCLPVNYCWCFRVEERVLTIVHW
jgi:hypothetical protein